MQLVHNLLLCSMSFYKKIVDALSSPYPTSESIAEELRGNAVAALIVGVILFVLRPFGLTFYQGSIFWISVGFAGVSFVMGMCYNFTCRFLFHRDMDVEQYNLGKWILDVIGLIIFIAFGNLLFAAIVIGLPFSLEGFFFSLVATFIIGIFPLTYFGFQNQLRLERLNTKRALNTLDKVSQHQVKEETLEVLLLIQSMENYIHVYKKNKGSLVKETYRRTLKSAQDDEAYHGLIKCHRSFLFNPDEVIDIMGNAQGLKLKMNHQDSPIVPVSRSFIESARRAIESSAL